MAKTKEAPQKIGTKRYSPTTVVRSVLKGYRWAEIERYDDATVQDLDRDRILGSPSAMLRAYSPDPEDPFVYGDEEERQGSGTHLSKDGYVRDCDGDIDVKRIVMNAVLSVHHFGHGAVSYVGVVSFEEVGAWGSGTRQVNEWTGRGDLEQIRLEQWDVRLKDDEIDDEDEE